MDRIVSHYRILESLGMGGMGEVYAGLDETLKRKVALKAIRRDQRLSAFAKARFLREARLLSQLDHPNVCRVYDYIEEDDGDWLVLELVEGTSLRDALQRGLDRSSKLAIAEQIAGALVAAHTADVVHRDLKPHNVMVTSEGQAKVMDFGLARTGGPETERAEAAEQDAPPQATAPARANAQETARVLDAPRFWEPSSPGSRPSREELAGFQTQAGAIMGTLGYMSPEQARGEVATSASDMYSFGLLLQELFTGRPAFDSEVEYETLFENVKTGRTLAPAGVGADLARLIERLKSVPPSQRPTAVEAEERLRWIRGKPKRRLRILAAVGALVVLALGGVKYTLDLERERTAAVQARQEADGRRKQAEDLIGFMLGDLREKLEPVGRLEILDDVGAKAMAYFAAVPVETLSDEELLRRSKALYQIGSVRIAQGNLEAAGKPLEESLDLAKALVARSPADGERLYELAQSHFWVGFVRWRRRDLDAALEHFRAYSGIAERLVGQDPGRTDWRLELASAHSNIGSVLQERDDSDGALAQFRACLAIEQALLDQEPDNNAFREAVAASNNTIGEVQRSRGRLAEALEHHRTELAIREELVRREPGNTTWRMYLGVSHTYVGGVLEALGNVADALKHYRAALAISNALAVHDPTNMEWKRELARHHFKIGRALGALGARRAEALEHLQTAVAVLRALVAGDSSNSGWQRDLAEARSSLGDALHAGGELDAAAREATAALAIADRLLASGPGDRQALRLRSLGHALLGRVWSTWGRATRAREAWQESLASIEPAARTSNDDRLLDPWSSALLHLDRLDEASVVVEKLASTGYRYPPFVSDATSRGMSGLTAQTRRPTRRE
jgi:tetratricopeptide (TPR) repeat protein/tRNA A-37 threonylcarbamoyl transferase component Bud32